MRFAFPESLADGHQHAAGRARLRHVRVQDAAAAAADADGPPRPVPAGRHVGPGGAPDGRRRPLELDVVTSLSGDFNFSRVPFPTRVAPCPSRLQGALHLNDTVVPQPHLLHLSAERVTRDGAFLLDCGNVSFQCLSSFVVKKNKFFKIKETNVTLKENLTHNTTVCLSG